MASVVEGTQKFNLAGRGGELSGSCKSRVGHRLSSWAWVQAGEVIERHVPALPGSCSSRGDADLAGPLAPGHPLGLAVIVRP